MRGRWIVHEILLLCESFKLKYWPGIAVFAHFNAESDFNWFWRLNLIRLTAEFYSMANVKV